MMEVFGKCTFSMVSAAQGSGTRECLTEVPRAASALSPVASPHPQVMVAIGQDSASSDYH